MSTQRRDLNNFDKLCEKCGDRKHVSKFKWRGVVMKACNSCENRLTKYCPRCKHTKSSAAFYRNHSVAGICNECEAGSEKIREETIRSAFELLDQAGELSAA